MGNHEDHAAMSARHLSEAGDRIDRQRDLIAYLRKRGLATASAEALLTLYEEIMSAMLVHDRIVRRLARV